VRLRLVSSPQSQTCQLLSFFIFNDILFIIDFALMFIKKKYIARCTGFLYKQLLRRIKVQVPPEQKAS
jgi:hypothetical protein